MAASPTDVGLNLFDWLRDSMPETTWRKVSAALDRVLGDEDGDPRLHSLLERTVESGKEQRRQRAS
jgi:hypothetical protein